MGRVEEENQARAQAEAERLQKRIDRDQRDAKAGAANREAFGNLMKSQAQQHDVKKQGAEKQGAEKQANEKQAQTTNAKSEAERRAMLARSGLTAENPMKHAEQARSFEGQLQKVHTETKQNDTQRVEKRDTGVKNDRVEREDRATETVQKQENKRDTEQELARVEQYEAKRANAAIGSGGKGDANSGGDSRGGDDGAAAAAAALKKQQPQVQQAEKAQAAHDVKQIPPELLEKLVSTVHLAVNQKGMREFQIELKEGVLSGATLKISAENGKVALKFVGLDAQKKNLIEASKGELMRKLEGKGLKLSRLDVG
jgi:hypothetical protein